MTNEYTPINVALSTVTEPVDGELGAAASLTMVTRTLANGIKNILSGRGLKATIFDFTASGDLVIPANALPIAIDMGWGGGGGGGSGCGAPTAISDDDGTCGGGGGCGADFHMGIRVITPGNTEPVVVGAAGAGSTAQGATGGTGGDTLVGTAGAIAKMMGGAGGGYGIAGPASDHRVIFGGRRRLMSYPAGYVDVIATTVALLAMHESQGGFGVQKRFATALILDGVGASSRFYAGGNAGTAGTTGGASNPGGGPGGGGGGGPGGVGGNGGNGGNSVAAGTPGSGTNGGSAAANTGAGGGGGGGGGTDEDDNDAGNGGNGGAGGTGFYRSVLFVPMV